MSAKNEKLTDTIWLSVRTGAVAVALSMLLFLPAAFLICRGWIRVENERTIALGCAVLAGTAACFFQRIGKGRSIAALILSALISALILLILAAGIPGSAMRLSLLLTSAAAYTVGIVIGWIMQNNKMDTKKRRHR